VRDDVVELARDPDPLLRHRGSRLLLAFALGRQRPRLQVQLALATMPDRSTGEPRPAHDQEKKR
jgi:hypothetical protein